MVDGGLAGKLTPSVAVWGIWRGSRVEESGVYIERYSV